MGTLKQRLWRRDTYTTSVKSLVLLPLLFSAAASAQSMLKEELKIPTKKKWGVTSTLSSTSSLQDTRDANHTAESRLTIAPNFRISDDLKVTASFSGVQQINGGQKSSLSNTRLSLQQAPRRVTDNAMWFPTAITDLPTDVEGRKRSTYRGNAAAQATGVISANAWQHNFSIIPIVRFTRNFHRLTRTADDTANIQQSALTAVYMETGLIKNLSLSVGGSYNYGWTYQSSTRESFSLSQELSYEVDKALTVSVGHSNDGNIFAADGQQNNVRLFDENTSAVFVSLRGVY